MNKSKKDITLIVAPNIGLIDNLLPILYEINNLYELNLNVIFLNKKITLSLKKNTFLEILDSINCNYFITFNEKDFFYIDEFKNIENVISRYYKLIFLFNMIKIFKKIFKLNIFNNFNNVLIKLINKNNPISKKFIYEEFKKTEFIFFDIGEQDVCLNIFPFLKKINCKYVSINNGIAMHHLSLNKMIVNNTKEQSPFKNIVHYIFNDKEINYYKKKFNLKENQIKKINIPRHNKKWINFFKNYYINDIPKSFNNYVIIGSKPGTNIAFSKKNKIICIKILKKILIDELNLNIVIKKHPKELNDVLYEKIFGKSNYNKNWTVTNNHIFNLGNKAKFCISFGGSLPIDLINLDVLSIEFRDLNGILEYDNENSLRDNNDNPISYLGFTNIVETASKEHELREKIEYIIKNKEFAIKSKKNLYLKCYLNPVTDNSDIAKEILTL